MVTYFGSVNMDLVNIYRRIIRDSSSGWALFKHGTCVVINEPEKDIRGQAITILKEHGSTTPGTPTADFQVIKIREIDGWVVTGDYPGIMIYVSREEAGYRKSDFEIGIRGRTKRELDAKELIVEHVEEGFDL